MYSGTHPRAGGERGGVAQRVTATHRRIAASGGGRRARTVGARSAASGTMTGWAPPSVSGLLQRIAENNVMKVVRCNPCAPSRSDDSSATPGGATHSALSLLQDRGLFVPFMLGDSNLGYLSVR